MEDPEKFFQVLYSGIGPALRFDVGSSDLIYTNNLDRLDWSKQMNWQLQEAKNKLSEVVNKACSSGPQVITVRGKETAVVVSAEEFRRLTHQQGSLLEFFQNSPLCGVELDIERPRDFGRDVKL